MPSADTTSTALRRRVNSLAVNEQRLAAMWRMSADERNAAAHRGELSLGEMLRWASRLPHEVPLVNGEFFFITAQSQDAPYDPSQDL